ncbi:uncharacterized protein PG998_001206 [Apiospora kogelbergensis]|uniref:uncharacterized protein n=1 Tax=Apiospora kogelbergensis TaxID=1337665 RepID=UPI0031325722
METQRLYTSLSLSIKINHDDIRGVGFAAGVARGTASGALIRRETDAKSIGRGKGEFMARLQSLRNSRRLHILIRIAFHIGSSTGMVSNNWPR